MEGLPHGSPFLLGGNFRLATRSCERKSVARFEPRNSPNYVFPRKPLRFLPFPASVGHRGSLPRDRPGRTEEVVTPGTLFFLLVREEYRKKREKSRRLEPRACETVPGPEYGLARGSSVRTCHARTGRCGPAFESDRRSPGVVCLPGRKSRGDRRGGR